MEEIKKIEEIIQMIKDAENALEKRANYLNSRDKNYRFAGEVIITSPAEWEIEELYIYRTPEACGKCKIKIIEAIYYYDMPYEGISYIVEMTKEQVKQLIEELS